MQNFGVVQGDVRRICDESVQLFTTPIGCRVAFAIIIDAKFFCQQGRE